MLLFSSDVLIEHYIFQIPQMFLVLSPCPNKFLYFTTKYLKFDSSSYSIFETNFSVPLVKFLLFFQKFKRNLWILLHFYAFVSQSQNFAFNYCALNSSQLIVAFVFYSYNFHMRYVVRIFLNLIEVCNFFVLKLWAIELVFLHVHGNHLEKVFLRKLLKPPQVSEGVVFR